MNDRTATRDLGEIGEMGLAKVFDSGTQLRYCIPRHHQNFLAKSDFIHLRDYMLPHPDPASLRLRTVE